MPIVINAKERPRKKTGEIIDKLNILNFALGIRAEEINENFELLKYWIEAERLRMGGWGLVEGFELTKVVEKIGDVFDFKIHVDKGVLINEKGEEIHVDEWMTDSIPVNKDQVAETLIVDEEGKLKLEYPIYSNRWRHVIYYAPEMSAVDGISAETIINEIRRSNELKIYELSTNRPVDLTSDIVYIAEKEICLHPNWIGKELRIEYLHADDRIDGIFVKNDGSEYSYKKNIGVGNISTSPSIQNIQDYFEQGWLLIGFAYWHVGQIVDVEFFTGDRMLRKVFVDRNNILYLNGKPYQEKTVIYFVEPNPPQENDLWYDVETEILYIWRKGPDGEYGWQPVNDLARSVTEIYQFRETENPDDLQTLNFFNHPKLFFMPGRHQLMVIIDQVVIMEDQYEELYYGKDEIEALDPEIYPEQYAQLQKNLCGYGIRFKYPLERPSVIEIRVTHDLNTRKHEEDLFQHEHVFTQTGQYTVEDPSANVFSAKCEYEYGTSQLEVFLNGLKLSPDKYTEIQKAENSGLCDRFSIENLLVGDIVDFRVIRTVSSYANLKLIIKEYEDKIKELTETVTENVLSINQEQEIIRGNQDELEENVAMHTAQITALQQNALTKTYPVVKENLAQDLRNGIATGKINKKFITNMGTFFLEDVKPTDFIVVAYEASNDTDMRLLSEARNDFALEESEDGTFLHLDGRWLDDAAAAIYITGLKIGV